MILVSFFASSTVYGSTKNLLSLPFQAPVFFGLCARIHNNFFWAMLANYNSWAGHKVKLFSSELPF